MLAGGNPFVTVDKEAVIGDLRAIGSRDPDVLRAKKLAMIRSLRLPKLLGGGLLLLGVVLSRTIAGLAAGLPVVLVGVWLWWRGAKNVAAVEAGYSEFVKSPTG